MIFECPGSQKFKAPYPEVIKCPSCGAELEIWSDEAETRCEKCGIAARRSSGQCCLDWCKYARKCVDPDKFNKYKQSKEKNNIRGGEIK